MAIRTVKGLIKYHYKKMREQGRVPSHNEVIGKYLLIIGIRWEKDVLETMVADETSTADPLDTYKMTKFFVDITKTVPGFHYKTDKLTKEHVSYLLDNKYDPIYNADYKKNVIEEDKKDFMERLAQHEQATNNTNDQSVSIL